MDLHTIQTARAKFMAKRGEEPTTLYLPSCDATKLLNDLIGKGLLPKVQQDDAVKAYAAGDKAVMEFFKNNKILDMTVKLTKVVS